MPLNDQEIKELVSAAEWVCDTFDQANTGNRLIADTGIRGQILNSAIRHLKDTVIKCGGKPTLDRDGKPIPHQERL